MSRVTVKEAAELMNCSEQFIRIGLQRGNLPFGVCVKTSTRYTYYIPRERLNAYLEGRDMKKPPCGNRTATATSNVAERT